MGKGIGAEAGRGKVGAVVVVDADTGKAVAEEGLEIVAQDRWQGLAGGLQAGDCCFSG